MDIRWHAAWAKRIETVGGLLGILLSSGLFVSSWTETDGHPGVSPCLVGDWNQILVQRRTLGWLAPITCPFPSY
jgi:hypothetical protein